MKSNKGFTLIELLAVIVILAIIALIATPTILGVIDTARKGAAESSALGYIDAVEKQILLDELATKEDDKTGISVPSTGTASYSVSAIKNVSVKGDAPTGGTVVIDTTGAVAEDTCLVINLNSKDYYIHYDGKKASATDEACTTSTTDSSSVSA
jgi:type IV pilus assembly protein PilA